jgi:hypothetical protein
MTTRAQLYNLNFEPVTEFFEGRRDNGGDYWFEYVAPRDETIAYVTFISDRKIATHAFLRPRFLSCTDTLKVRWGRKRR